MKKKKYLEFYERTIKTGKLPKNGLCFCFIDDDYLKLFSPGKMGGYWGYYMEFYDHVVLTQDVDKELSDRLCNEFNPLRQTIVLFMAAMNNEL